MILNFYKASVFFIMLFVGADVQSQNEEILARSAYGKAEAAFGNGDIRNAEIHLKQAISYLNGNTNPQLQYLLTKIYVWKKEWILADDAMKSYFKLANQDHQYYIEMVDISSGIKSKADPIRRAIEKKRIDRIEIEKKFENEIALTSANLRNLITSWESSAKNGTSACDFLNNNLEVFLWISDKDIDLPVDVGLYLNLFRQEKNYYEVMYFTPSTIWKPIRMSDNRIMFLDVDGNILVNNSFQEAKPFSNFGFAAVKKNNLWGVIDFKGRQIIECELDELTKYRGRKIVGVKNGKTVVLNHLGEVINENYKIHSFHHLGRHTKMEADGTLSFITENKNILVNTQLKGQFSSNYISSVGSNYIILKNNNEKLGVVDWKGNVIIDFKFDNLSVCSNTFLLRAENNSEKYGVIDINERIHVPFEYDDISYFGVGQMISARKNGKTGIINFRNEIEINFKYDRVRNFGADELAVVNKGDYAGLIDKNGNELIGFKYDNIYDFARSVSLRPAKLNGNIVFLDLNGKEVFKRKYDYSKYSWPQFNSRGILIFELEKDENEEFRNYIYLNSKGEEVFKRSIHGTIVSEKNGNALIGATAYFENNSRIGTATDSDGNFTLELPSSVTFPISIIYAYGKKKKKVIRLENIADIKDIQTIRL